MPDRSDSKAMFLTYIYQANDYKQHSSLDLNKVDKQKLWASILAQRLFNTWRISSLSISKRIKGPEQHSLTCLNNSNPRIFTVFRRAMRSKGAKFPNLTLDGHHKKHSCISTTIALTASIRNQNGSKDSQSMALIARYQSISKSSRYQYSRLKSLQLCLLFSRFRATQKMKCKKLHLYK